MFEGKMFEQIDGVAMGSSLGPILATSSVYIHSKLTNHNIDFASPVILAHDNVKLRLQVKETILIKEHTAYNSLNRNTGSFHLTLW